MPETQFIAYLVDETEKGYLYARIDGVFYRIVSPTTEDSYVVTFNSRDEMNADIDAVKHVVDNIVCFSNHEYSPIQGSKFQNLANMLHMQGRLCA